MKDGKIIQQGSPEEIYFKPINEYAAGMFGKYNLLKPAVAALFGIESKGNDVMTRPENFKIYKTGNGVNGIINKINFAGSFYEAEVLINDEIIFVRTSNKELIKGEKVFVSLNK
jgi:ABC-type Fe3+/spermidine/putrescine transport system ATPase subunit